MQIYIYGIIDSHYRIDGSIAGLGGANVYNISYRDIGATASNLNEELKNITSDRALEHEGVVERLMEHFTVLPVRFLTIFNREEDVISMMKEHYRDFKENLSRLCDKMEFGIKVIWPADTIKKRIIAAFNRDNSDVSVSADSAAKIFLKEKLEKYSIEKEFKEEADRCISVVDERFNQIAAEKKLQKLQTEKLLLNAAYLVEKEKQDNFKQAFEQLKSATGDLEFLFSGPWPPYNFISLSRKLYMPKDFDGTDIFDARSAGNQGRR
ncbi:MAG: GvpL/GvpF family gas vesicle protein [Candidatus Omnitrophota bacterium]